MCCVYINNNTKLDKVNPGILVPEKEFCSREILTPRIVDGREYIYIPPSTSTHDMCVMIIYISYCICLVFVVVKLNKSITLKIILDLVNSIRADSQSKLYVSRSWYSSMRVSPYPAGSQVT